MRPIQAVVEILAQSSFRKKQQLNEKEKLYLSTKGKEIVVEEGLKLLATRLFIEQPKNDGKQTPWHGHPIFVAQHATATCCRTCLEKVHNIPKNIPLNEDHKNHVLTILKYWLLNQ